MLNKKTLQQLWIVCGLALLTACQTVQTTQPGTVGVTRKQSIMGSLDAESKNMNQQAAQAYTATLQEASGKRALNVDPVQTDRVRRIANRLIPHVNVFRPEAAAWKWEVNVLNSDDVNAWCMPGGKIAVYTGLIQKLSITDDELAAVMGHEISHALREHALERQPRAQAAQVAGFIGVVGFGVMGIEVPPELTQSLAMAAIALPNSREQESEADLMGLELAARAGFNPNGAVSLWQKMEKLGGGAPPKIFSTHPPSAERQVDLKAAVPIVMPLYEASKKK